MTNILKPLIYLILTTNNFILIICNFIKIYLYKVLFFHLVSSTIINLYNYNKVADR